MCLSVRFSAQLDVESDADFDEPVPQIVGKLEEAIAICRVRDAGASDRAAKSEEPIPEGHQAVVVIQMA